LTFGEEFITMSPAPKLIAMRLKTIRERKGLSQTAVATKAGIAREHLTRLEAGAYSPSVDTLEKIAQALGVSLLTLLRAPGRRRTK
jgi:transcriptional regulator with XRE-family HTH domain